MSYIKLNKTHKQTAEMILHQSLTLNESNLFTTSIQLIKNVFLIKLKGTKLLTLVVIFLAVSFVICSLIKTTLYSLYINVFQTELKSRFK